MPALTVDRCCEQAYGVPTAGGLSGLEGTNSEWGYDASTGQVKVSKAADLLGKTACKDDIENCCLIAKPCDWPCNALGDGSLFILILTLGAAGYLGGGALHAHKTQGKTLAADGWQAMVPHRARWVELGALVQDGIQFSRARLRGAELPPGGGGSMDAALLPPASDGGREQKESGGGKKKRAGKKRSKQKRKSLTFFFPLKSPKQVTNQEHQSGSGCIATNGPPQTL